MPATSCRLGRKRKFLNSGNPVLQAVLGGWNLAGYFRYTDGSALSFSATNNLSYLGYGAKFANYVPGVPIFGVTNPRDFDPGCLALFRSGRRLCHSPRL